MQIDPSTLSHFSEKFVDLWKAYADKPPSPKMLLRMRQFVDSAIIAWMNGLDVKVTRNLPRIPPHLIQHMLAYSKQAARARELGYYITTTGRILSPDFVSATIKKGLNAHPFRDSLNVLRKTERDLRRDIAAAQSQPWMPHPYVTLAAALIITVAIAQYLWRNAPLPHDLYDIGLNDNEIYLALLTLDFESPTDPHVTAAASHFAAYRTRNWPFMGEHAFAIESRGWEDDPQSYANVQWTFPPPLFQRLTLIFHAQFIDPKSHEGFAWWLRLPCPHVTIMASGILEKSTLGISHSSLAVPGGFLHEYVKPKTVPRDYMPFRADIFLPTGLYTRYFAYSEEIVTQPVPTQRWPATANKRASLSIAAYQRQPEGSTMRFDNIFCINHGPLLPSLSPAQIPNLLQQPLYDSLQLPPPEPPPKPMRRPRR